MDTKLKIIDFATTLFQQKGFKSVGLNEILKGCNIAKGSLYHHFPKGKEEILIACLESMSEAITRDIEVIFKKYKTTQEGLEVIIEQMIADFERKGTITGYTFSSIVREMFTLSESARNACSYLYTKIQRLCSNKLLEDGFSKESVDSIALMLVALVEGGIMLCLAHKSSEPLKIVSQQLHSILRDH